MTMILYILMILIGTPLAVWILANPDIVNDAKNFIEETQLLWKIGAFIAIQPLAILTAQLLSKALRPNKQQTKRT